MRTKNAAVFLCSVGLGLTLSMAGAAHAWWRQVHASGCNPSAYAADLSLLYYGSSYGYYNYSSRYVTFLCATENSQDHPKESATGFWIGVTDHRTDAEVTARACAQGPWGSAALSCGPWVGTGVSFTGGSTLYPSLSIWNNASTRYYDAYVAVSLPGYVSSSGGSAFSGYEIGF